MPFIGQGPGVKEALKNNRTFTTLKADNRIFSCTMFCRRISPQPEKTSLIFLLKLDQYHEGSKIFYRNCYFLTMTQD
jgi:hypothetical protein